MGRVLEALQRQQDNEETYPDPLAAKVSSPEIVSDAAIPSFEMPDRIGSPIGPRSNEGTSMTFFSEEELSRTVDEFSDFGQSSSIMPTVTRTRSESIVPGNKGKAPTAKSGQVYSPPITVEPSVPTTVCLDESRLHTRLVLFTDPQSDGCEQYRTLRTQVFHAAEKQLTQVILATSAVAGEGKTSTVLNLAWAIAQSREKRVLVIDGDLRRPSVSPYLGLDFELGFGEVISEISEALPAIVRVADSTLYILSSSREEAQPAELLSKERVGEIIEELRKYFDFILIDAPPVVAFADARLLANHADAVMVIVRAGMAGHNTVERAIEALPGSRVLGVVLNGVDQMSEVGYYGYYGYGYTGYAKKEQPSFLEKIGLGQLAERFKKKSETTAEEKKS